jgi:hypothetical protein
VCLYTGDDWKLLFVKFLSYPRDERTLVSFDPEVFSCHADGSSTIDIRERIFGITGSEALVAKSVTLKASELWPGVADGTELAIITRVKEIHPTRSGLNPNQSQEVRR